MVLHRVPLDLHIQSEDTIDGILCFVYVIKGSNFDIV